MTEADLQWYEEQILLGLDYLETGRVLTQEEMRTAVEKELAAILARHVKSKNRFEWSRRADTS